jgi:hypothetical protein
MQDPRWAHQKHIIKLISEGIVNPNQFAEILGDEPHHHRNMVLEEINNRMGPSSHKIGKKRLKKKWTYTPQYYWVTYICR